MPFKKVERGIYSYYKSSDTKKKHICYYYSTTGTDGKTIKVKSNNLGLNWGSYEKLLVVTPRRLEL